MKVADITQHTLKAKRNSEIDVISFTVTGEDVGNEMKCYC